MELLGRFEDSGFKEAPYLARRSDGQVVQMAPLLHALAEEVDGERTSAQIGEAISHRIERGVTAEMVEMLVDEQLRPLGVVAPADGSQPALKKVDPLLALKFRTRVVPERLVAALTRLFTPLFFPTLVMTVIFGLVALDIWLFGFHGISQSVRSTLYQPALLLVMLGGVLVATTFHEIGHATACRYGGARPGVMGIGIYIVWPAFYTDVTDAYRLDKRGRLRTDLGGMYFNAVFALAVAAGYALTGFEPLLLLIVIQNVTILQQALPFLRLDGYYIVSDLTGVPDILTRMRPLLESLLPWRRADQRVTVLKPWVRVAVTAYVTALVPVVGFIFAMLLIHAPRLFATGYDSFSVHLGEVEPYLRQGQIALGVFAAFQMIVLVLPAFGMVLTTGRVGRRFGRAAWRWSAGRPLRRAGLLIAGAAIGALLAHFWWPSHEYRPIQPGERGTIGSGIRSIERVATGHRPVVVVAVPAQPAAVSAGGTRHASSASAGGGRRSPAGGQRSGPQPLGYAPRPRSSPRMRTPSYYTSPDPVQTAPGQPTQTAPTTTTPTQTTPTTTAPPQGSTGATGTTGTTGTTGP